METAWLEAQQGFAFKAQPLTICAYAVDCADIVDLGDEAGRRDVSLVIDELACAWEDLALRGVEPPRWRVAKRLVAGGCAGILYQALRLVPGGPTAMSYFGSGRT
jgi:RES domain-containing protein